MRLWYTADTTVLHCTALYCTALHCTVLHCTARSRTWTMSGAPLLRNVMPVSADVSGKGSCLEFVCAWVGKTKGRGSNGRRPSAGWGGRRACQGTAGHSRGSHHVRMDGMARVQACRPDVKLPSPVQPFKMRYPMHHHPCTTTLLLCCHSPSHVCILPCIPSYAQSQACFPPHQALHTERSSETAGRPGPVPVKRHVRPNHVIHRPHMHGTRVGAAVSREAGVDDAGCEVAAVGVAGQATVDEDLRVEDGRRAPRIDQRKPLLLW